MDRSLLVALAGLLAGSLAFTACDGRQAAKPPDGAVESAKGVPKAAGFPGEDQPASGLPPRGTALVWPSPRGVTVLANEAPRRRVLQDMARERDFELKIAGGTALAGMLTLSALDAPLEEVLPQVLEGLPYTVSYRIDALTGTRLPSRVFVGQGAELASAPASVASPPKPNRARAAAPSDPREDDREKRESAQRAYLDELESDDFNVRANAAALAYADPEAVPAISDLLESDPDPQVRAAAAGTLGEADDSPAAVRALLRALNDPDPAVVIEAIDGLEWTADASVIPDMQFLLDHPSGEVRERTVEAIEWFAD